VRPFTDKQIELVENFAAQAVIAIENARLLNELRQRTNDLTERTADLTKSLEQQTATSEVLRVISSSPGDLQPVFDALLENATRLCEASYGAMWLCQEGKLRIVGLHGELPESIMERWRAETVSLDTDIPMTRAIRRGRPMQVNDLREEPAYLAGEPLPVAGVEIAGIRTLVIVPMFKDSEPVGSIAVYRKEVRPFTDKQIELLQNFAAQAVIAIENVRLLNELRESLQQQTATADVLKVISSSPSDLNPVFGAMLESATRICEAAFGSMLLRDGDGYRRAAQHNVSQKFSEYGKQTPVFPRGTAPTVDRVIDTRQALHLLDVAAENPNEPIAKFGGARTLLVVPMLKDNEAIGVIGIYRQEVRPFSDRQSELVTNFAAQAVIAIENARLLNELRQRTADLTERTADLSEALDQQTATSDVLRVISSSPSDIQPVLETIGERAEKLCDAEISVVSIVDGELIRLASIHGMTEAGVEAARRVFPARRTDESVTARAIRTRSVCHVADVLSDPQYSHKDTARISGYRGCLGVPMVRDEQVVGAIFVARRQPGLFSDAQVQLLKTFADQAVIAIENVRLFKETTTSLEQQTATADVLKIISRSTFDLRAVLQTLVESAARFCHADKASIIREKDGVFYAAEAYGYSPEFLEYIKNIPIKAERGTASGRALAEGRVVHIADAAADPEYRLVEARRLGDYRTILCVPMLREGVPIGLLVLTRSEVQAFTEKQIELVTTFANQAAIAIENVRLFESVEARTRELAKSLDDLRTAQDRLVQTGNWRRSAN
jgi:GAF domain-containing protein